MGFVLLFYVSHLLLIVGNVISGLPPKKVEMKCGLLLQCGEEEFWFTCEVCLQAKTAADEEIPQMVDSRLFCTIFKPPPPPFLFIEGSEKLLLLTKAYWWFRLFKGYTVPKCFYCDLL